MNFLFSKKKSKLREDVDGYGFGMGYICQSCSSSCRSSCSSVCGSSCSSNCIGSCSGSSSSNYPKKKKKCETCYREFEDDWKYCPHDGTLLKNK